MRQKDDTKAEDILAATLEEVRVSGLAKLSMEAVARRAGVATGTLYIYFRNKNALVDTLYLRIKARMAAFTPRDDALPLRAAFSAAIQSYLDYTIENKSEVVFMEQAATSPLISRDVRAQAALGMKPLTALLDRGKAEHLLKDLDTTWMITFLLGALKDMAAMAAGLSPQQRREHQDRVASVCWDALKA